MGVIRIQPAATVGEAARQAFDANRARVMELLSGAEVEHVGSTAVPGALTKGDVDVLVRVPAENFHTAVEGLSRAYVIHQPQNWTSTFASFTEPEATEPPVGVQLVVSGSVEDAFFGPFRDELIDDPALLAEYNALKQSLDGADYERYTAEKGQFIERVLQRLKGR